MSSTKAKSGGNYKPLTGKQNPRGVSRKNYKPSSKKVAPKKALSKKELQKLLSFPSSELLFQPTTTKKSSSKLSPPSSELLFQSTTTTTTRTAAKKRTPQKLTGQPLEIYVKITKDMSLKQIAQFCKTSKHLEKVVCENSGFWIYWLLEQTLKRWKEEDLIYKLNREVFHWRALEKLMKEIVNNPKYSKFIPEVYAQNKDKVSRVLSKYYFQITAKDLQWKTPKKARKILNSDIYSTIATDIGQIFRDKEVAGVKMNNLKNLKLAVKVLKFGIRNGEPRIKTRGPWRFPRLEINEITGENKEWNMFVKMIELAYKQGLGVVVSHLRYMKQLKDKTIRKWIMKNFVFRQYKIQKVRRKFRGIEYFCLSEDPKEMPKIVDQYDYDDEYVNYDCLYL